VGDITDAIMIAPVMSLVCLCSDVTWTEQFPCIPHVRKNAFDRQFPWF
jgi:hypothetical protein